MISIEKARKCLESLAEGLTDKQVQEVIDWHSHFAEMAIEVVEKNNSLEKLGLKKL